MSRGIAIAGRVAAAGGALAAIVAAYLMFAAVSAGDVDCGRLADQTTWEYSVDERPTPPALSGCVQALNRQAVDLTIAAKTAGILFVVAAIASLSSKLVRRLEAAAVAASCRRKMSALRPGADVRVIRPASAHDRRRGTVVDMLPSTDEFDVIVTFNEADADIYAFRYQELRPVKTNPLSKTCWESTPHATADLVLI